MFIKFLKEDKQLLIETFTGRRVVNGPRSVWVNPLWKIMRRQGITLGPTAYLHISDKLTGELKNVIGPCLYFLGANEVVDKNHYAIFLTSNQYIRIINKKTGIIRVERGEAEVYLMANRKQIHRIMSITHH